jgi:hypothetical protein
MPPSSHKDDISHDSSSFDFIAADQRNMRSLPGIYNDQALAFKSKKTLSAGR